MTKQIIGRDMRGFFYNHIAILLSTLQKKIHFRIDCFHFHHILRKTALDLGSVFSG